MLRVISANLNGIRSAVSKGFLTWLPQQDADFICLQELKAQAADMTPEMLAPSGYQGYFHYAEKKGYSGVGIYTRRTPQRVIEGLGVPEIDAEGRYLELVFGTLSVVSVYLPSGSSGEDRQAAKFRFMEHFFDHLAQLARAGREVVLCGDWNIAHQEIDLKNWKGNRKNSGFLPEERSWLTRLSPPVPRRHRSGIHLVEQSRASLGQERGLAHRLPDRHAGPGRQRAGRFDLQDRALQRPCAPAGRLQPGALSP
jgi:exodeoxyribonuclease-3